MPVSLKGARKRTPSSQATVAQVVPRSQVLLIEGASGPVWRVRAGAFRLERRTPEGASVVQIALAGDLLGVESLCGQPYACSAIALTDAWVEPDALLGQSREAALGQGFCQQQRQIYEMTLLRSGPVVGRLRHLLDLLARRADGAAQPLERSALPVLKDIAQIVLSAPETVCRELNRLLPARPRRPGRLVAVPWAAALVGSWGPQAPEGIALAR